MSALRCRRSASGAWQHRDGGVRLRVDRRTASRVAILGAIIVLAIIGAAMGSRLAPSAPTSEVTGVVVGVDAGTGLGDVRGFTLRLAGGELLTFSLRALQNGTEFPPGHLAEHQATAAPVRVTYRMEGSERLATHLDDAPR